MDLIRRGLRRALMPPPSAVRHAEYSMLFSADDEVAPPNDRLLDVGLGAVQAARGVDLSELGRRLPPGPNYAELWPGEHYKLLAGLVEVVQPKLVIEIGTATGLSALTLLERLPEGGRVETFDVVPWREYPGAILRDSDLADGRLVQHIADLTQPAVASQFWTLLEQADLIFADAAKDGVMERRFLKLFDAVPFKNAPLVLFDDIRLWNMLDIWRGIKRPKLDLTSFGHWSGTGLVDYA